MENLVRIKQARKTTISSISMIDQCTVDNQA